MGAEQKEKQEPLTPVPYAPLSQEDTGKARRGVGHVPHKAQGKELVGEWLIATATPCLCRSCVEQVATLGAGMASLC